MASNSVNQLRQRADELVRKLATAPTKGALDDASTLLDELRKNREFEYLGTIAELASRYRPSDLRARRLLAQSMTEQGKASVAADIATVALGQAEKTGDPEYDELSGILGRACKQIFVDDPTVTSGEVMSEGARAAIERAITAYRRPWQRDPDKNTWHGVNLAAMLHVADTRNLGITDDLNTAAVAADVLRALAATPLTERDTWWHATKAEAHVARSEWVDAESEIRAYVADDSVPAFNFASTLRQFRDVWRVQDAGPEGLGLIEALEAIYLERESGSFEDAQEKPPLILNPSHVRSIRAAPPPEESQLQRMLGTAGTMTVRWYRAGLDRAASVAAIREKLGTRIGTGFAVRSEDFGLDAGEILVLTNFHVVNTGGGGMAARPEDVEIVFECEDPLLQAPIGIGEIVAESPERGGLDYALLRLDRPADDIEGVPLASCLPQASTKERVYVIGHPLGHELQFSLQDNWVLDHEGPPRGKPPRPERVRIHYFAPTAKGSSGSPVFDDTWACIALHHAGAMHDPPPEDSGMRKLNGKEGYYSANEGIYIRSILDDVRKATQSADFN